MWHSGLLKSLNTMIKRFIWSSSVDETKLITGFWSQCCKLIVFGLGVRNMRLLNKALLRKFTWNFLLKKSFVF